MWLDCRGIEPTEAGLLAELALATGGAPGPAEEIAARLGQVGTKVIVALDTYELFRLMDTWLRQVFLPKLPDNVRFVLCGREAPVTAWLSDPGWHGLFRSIRLESLEQRDAAELLSRAGVPVDDAKYLDGICHGHPLALTLAASMRRTEVPTALRAAMGQRVVEELSSLFLSDITDPQTRRALEAASVVRRVTLPILSAMLPDASPQDAQERIRALPFVQPERDGLHIHDAVREAIAATLRADNPQQYHLTGGLPYRHFMTELRGAPASDFWRYTADLLYVLENPVVREAFFPSGGLEYAVEPAVSQDERAILDIIERHENSVTASYLKRWWSECAGNVCRGPRPEGFRRGLLFHLRSQGVFVPGSAVKIQSLARGWIIWIDSRCHASSAPCSSDAGFPATGGEAPSPVQAACWVDVKRKYLELRPNLRRVYLTLRDLEPYAAAAQKLGFRVLNEASVPPAAIAIIRRCWTSGLRPWMDGWPGW